MSTTRTGLRSPAVTIALIGLGVVLAIVAVVYFVTPANSLPSFFPGHAAHSTAHHVKHGLAFLGLAAVAWVGAWFTTGPSHETA